MKSGDNPATWETVGAIVQGATHIKQDKPCQDALYIHGALEAAPAPPYALACVADGHGSERCLFSDEGAKTACAIAADILAVLLESADPAEMLAAQKDIRLPKLLENRWKEAVTALHAQKTHNLADSEEIAPFSYELYGTTLLALAATESFIFAMQIGDGDIVAIDTGGNSRWLIPPCDHPGNETESLCLENAWQYVRTQLIPLNGENPLSATPMYLLSTDGYANSFTTSEGFLKVGTDIFTLWREKGRAYIEENLPHWLAQTSADGSGDDIALAIVKSTAINKNSP